MNQSEAMSRTVCSQTYSPSIQAASTMPKMIKSGKKEVFFRTYVPVCQVVDPVYSSAQNSIYFGLNPISGKGLDETHA